jgi:hypothetical protein
MRKHLLAVAAWVSLAAGGLSAQVLPYPQSSIRPEDFSSRPALSPYLNLLRGGDPASNYYLGVIPEFQRRFFENRAVGDFETLGRRTAQTRDLLDEILATQPLVRTLPPTGHATSFQNYGTYFSTLNPRR